MVIETVEISTLSKKAVSHQYHGQRLQQVQLLPPL
jgi:hypothetical protein